MAIRLIPEPPSNPPPQPLTLAAALHLTVHERLVQRGWSQRQLGQQLGVSQSAVSYFLHGQRRSKALDFYQRLACAFGMRLSDLIYDAEVLQQKETL